MADVLRADIVGRDMGATRTMRDFAGSTDIAAASARRFAEAEQAANRAKLESVAATVAAAKADKLLKDSSDSAIASVAKQRAETDKLKTSAADAAGKNGLAALAGGGGATGGGMAAVVAAGVALSPVIATVGTGLGGLALAAYGVAKPIENAAHKAGGLQANLAKLDPEQRMVARSVLGLGKDYAAFQAALKPEVLALFNAGIRIGGHLLKDVQPVAQATGKALDGVLGSIDKEFQSGTWQNFFGFMAQHAGPDVALVGKNFTDLLHILPGVLQDLQPLGTGLLQVSDDTIKAANGVRVFYDSFQRDVPISNQHTFNFIKDLDNWTVDLTNHLGGRAINNGITRFQNWLTGTAAPAQKAAASIHKVADSSHLTAQYLADTGERAFLTISPMDHLAKAADTVAFSQDNFGRAARPTVAILLAEASALNKVAAGYEKALTPLENYIGAQITEHDDLKTLNQALQASHDKIGLKTQAERNSFGAAQTYIKDTLAQGNAALAAHQGIDAQIGSIEQALPRLEHVRNKTAGYKQELDLLKNILDKLRAEKLIQEKVSVTGRGTWNVQGLPGPISAHIHGAGGFAAGTPGAPPGWAWVGEKGPELVYMRGGETVVPNHEIPGFASGVVGSYSGSPAGLPAWTAADQHATVTAITRDIAQSFASSFAAAFTGGGGGGGGGGALGGSAAANRALAMRMFPWPMSLFPAFDYVEMREAGYSLTARNPSSGAYGMAQFINGPAEYFQWGGNPFTAAGQLAAMFNYENSRYGGPVGAAAHERAFNWYGNGLHGGIFTRPTVIGVGDGGPERVDVTPLSRHGGRGPLVQFGDVIVNNETDEAVIRQKLSFAVVAAGLGS